MTKCAQHISLKILISKWFSKNGGKSREQNSKYTATNFNKIWNSDMLRKFEKLTRKIYMSLIGPIFIISILAITKSHFAKQCYITEFQLDETLQWFLLNSEKIEKIDYSYMTWLLRFFSILVLSNGLKTIKINTEQKIYQIFTALQNNFRKIVWKIDYKTLLYTYQYHPQCWAVSREFSGHCEHGPIELAFHHYWRNDWC